MALIEEPWRLLREQAAAIPEIAMAAVSASAAALLVRPDVPMSQRVEAAEAAGRKAMVAKWDQVKQAPAGMCACTRRYPYPPPF